LQSDRRWIPAAVPSRSSEDAAFVSRARLFAGISPADCRTLATSASAREYASDDLIYEQDQPLRHVLLILSGCVKLTQISSDGSEVILWLRGSLDALGVFGIPARLEHSCSARAIVNCRVLSWDWTRLNQTASASQIRQNIGHIVSERLGELEERFREVATENVERRVASAIGRISKHVGKVTKEGTEISLSREEMAQLTGTTVFSVSRLISRWSELGIVRPRRESFVILDHARLAMISAAESEIPASKSQEELLLFQASRKRL
jgi:CRP-like cAMP-binding protein